MSEATEWNSVVTRLGVPYYSISLSLNVLLTLMIVTRLIRHSRNIRNAIRPAKDKGLYDTVVTMLVESCALYAVGSLLFIGPLGAESEIQGIFAPIFVNVQVGVVLYHASPYIAILGRNCLIMVTNRLSLRSSLYYELQTGPHWRVMLSGESTGGKETLAGVNPASSMETNGETTRELRAGAENIIEEVPL